MMMINNEFLLRDRRHGILIRRFFRKADGAIFNCGCKGTDYFPNHKIFSGKKVDSESNMFHFYVFVEEDGGRFAEFFS